MLDPKKVALKAIQVWSGSEKPQGLEQVQANIERKMVHAPIEQSETGVIAWEAPKTAALCFDRVWTGEADHVPEGIRFFNGTWDEIVVALALAGASAASQLETPEIQKLDPKTRQDLRRLVDVLLGSTQILKERIPPGEDAFIGITRVLSESVNVPALYPRSRDQLPYSEGRDEVILCTMRDLEVVDEKALTWDQVVEFRRDKESRKKYRRLVHWLDKEMVGKTPNFIRDEIAEKLDAYSQALEKHGIKTVTGALSTLLKADKLLFAAAAGIALSKVDPFAGLCVASGTLIAKTAIEVVKSRLALADTKLGAEIAFVHDVKSRFG
jgi:hypothetical protein